MKFLSFFSIVTILGLTFFVYAEYPIIVKPANNLTYSEIYGIL